MKRKKNIIPQMFDVRPVGRDGSLDISKIEKVKKVTEISKQKCSKEEKISFVKKKSQNTFSSQRSKNFLRNDFLVQGIAEQKYNQKEKERVRQEINLEKNIPKKGARKKRDWTAYILEFLISYRRKKQEKREIWEKKQCDYSANLWQLKKQRSWRSFPFAKIATVFLIIGIFWGGFFLVEKGTRLKEVGLLDVQEALANFQSAKDCLVKSDFFGAKVQMEDAYTKLNKLSERIDGLGGVLVSFSKYFPYFSKISSGSHLVSAGKDISQAGIILGDLVQSLDNLKKGSLEKKDNLSYLQVFQDSRAKIEKALAFLSDAQNNLDEVNVSDIPEEMRGQFVTLKTTLPEINVLFNQILNEGKIFEDILGGKGPRKYLFLFQNNQEMRATGGFIGSYALLEISNGRVGKFFIDGIFNPDGQLKEDIVPPRPIQKISAAWSLHDSNWFPDFPVSAEKAAWFYEKTGGPTVDGVIAMTPNVMEKLLEVTGPIELPEYSMTVNKDNFVEKIQYETEVGYDKNLNRPKKVLADLAPKILDKIFNKKDASDLAKTVNIIWNSLNEKQILIYSKNWEIEKILSQNSWTGEVLKTEKDYLSVINTNINGFKTDGVVSEKIFHWADIQADGSVIDTVEIIRKHNGGDTPYDWWNRVNSDYMRVYVPKGSKLISAEGYTREFNTPPLDYDALGFARDPQVQMEEDSIQIDPDSGTRIYEDVGKTVFANWVYVSPKETVKIKYTYLLPFRVKVDTAKKPLDSYSVLFQKQSGSLGDSLDCQIKFPEQYNVIWSYFPSAISQGLSNSQNELNIKTDLSTDKFMAVSFSKKQQ